ncbi:MAG: Transposase, mutator type [Modestobacter sp.]|jgi:hypothetical protein|nr:Transposase, mutator type [Modestobacter sp.]
MRGPPGRTRLRHRGTAPEQATSPARRVAIVRTCVVHLIRASMRSVSHGDREEVAASLRRIHTAPAAGTAETALPEPADPGPGRKHPATVGTRQNAWERFTPFLAFVPAVRRTIDTADAIGSPSYQLSSSRRRGPAVHARQLFVPRCSATAPPVRLRHSTPAQPASCSQPASSA